MDIAFRMLDDGAFVAGDRDSEMTVYAYPTSPHAIVAKKHPKAVAEDMLSTERREYRNLPSVQEYDTANWRLIAGASTSTDSGKNEGSIIDKRPGRNQGSYANNVYSAPLLDKRGGVNGKA